MSSAQQVGKSLSMHRIRAAGGWLIQLAGTIDDSLDHLALTDGLSGWVIFDLEAVNRITSFGVREWMRGLAALPPASQYVFLNCQPGMMMQFNMVGRFGGRGQLVSFHAPYECAACGHVHSVLLDVRHAHPMLCSYTLPEVLCPACGQPSAFDDIPESYLAYVATHPRPSLPASINRLVDHPRPATLTPTGNFHIEMKIVGGVTALSLHGAIDDRASFKRVSGALDGEVVVDLGLSTELTSEGAARLASFLTSTELRPNLWRVPHQMLELLPPALEAAGPPERQPRLLSVLVPFWCASCGEHLEVDADHALLRGIRATARGPVCARCGQSTMLGLGSAAAERILALALEAPTAAVVGFLAAAASATPAAPGAPQRLDAPPEKLLVNGRYEVGQLIGVGGMAQIHAARQLGPLGFERQVALKRILPHLCRDAEFVSMFLQEARVAARLSHPNIVQIIELGLDDKQFFIAMELVKGWDLRLILRMMAKAGALMPVRLAARITLDVLGALRAAHENLDEHGAPAPVIHRDVSPHNILVSDHGVVKLTDFGIAKVADTAQNTPGGNVRGKLNYLAPERLLQMVGPMDPRPDIFAVAIILYQLLTNQHPFGMPTDEGLIKQIVDVDIIPARQYRPELSVPLVAHLAKAFDPRLEERFATAREFAASLEAALDDAPARSEELAVWLDGLVKEAALQWDPGREELTAVRPAAPALPAEAAALVKDG